MSENDDTIGLRGVAIEAVSALREVSAQLGKSAAHDASLAQVLRDTKHLLNEYKEIRIAANHAALAEARRQGHADAMAEVQRVADQESSQSHRALVVAVSEPVTDLARSSWGKRLISAAVAGALALFVAACAWGAHKLGISDVVGGQ